MHQDARVPAWSIFDFRDARYEMKERLPELLSDNSLGLASRIVGCCQYW